MNGTQNPGGHDGAHRSLFALVVGVATTLEGLFHGVDGQNPERNVDSGIHGSSLQARCRLARHVLEVGCIAPNDGAECDNGIDRSGRGEFLRDDGKFEGTRHPVRDDVRFVNAVRSETPNGTAPKRIDDVEVEGRTDDAKAHARSVDRRVVESVVWSDHGFYFPSISIK